MVAVNQVEHCISSAKHVLAESLYPSVSGMFCGGPLLDHVLNLDRGWRDMNHFVPPVDDFAFARNENILAALEENFLRLADGAGEAEELQRDRRAAAGTERRNIGWILFLSVTPGAPGDGNFDVFCLRDKNISSAAFVDSSARWPPANPAATSDPGFPCAAFFPGFVPDARRQGTRRHGSRGSARWKRRYRRTSKHGDDFIGHGQKRHDAEHSRPCRLLLVFESQLHYVPPPLQNTSQISSFTPNLTGPCGWPPRVTLLMMKNISSRSSALMKLRQRRVVARQVRFDFDRCQSAGFRFVHLVFFLLDGHAVRGRELAELGRQSANPG